MDRALAWHPHRIDLASESPFRVGGATVDPISRDAGFNGTSERLQPQHLKVLIALARHRGEVVTRDDLIERCWDGRFVGEDVINRSISMLRQFAARAGGFRIETVPKAGYRLVETDVRRPFVRRPAAIALIVAAAVALAALSAWLILRDRDGSAEPPVPRVAIAPLIATQGDVLSRQVAAATGASLAHMLTDSGFPIRTIASATDRNGSDFVIGGDVRRAGGKVTATINLIEARHGVAVFTHRYEEPESAAATLADQIGASIATNLTWTAAMMVLDRRDPFDPVSLTEQLTQLRLVVEGGDPIRALEISRQSAKRTPNKAMSQISVAFNSAFAFSALPSDERAEVVRTGRIAAIRAVQLAPHFGDAYIPWTILHPQVWMRERDMRLRAAMKRDPAAPFVAAFLNYLMVDAGRFDEGLELALIAIADDQYKPAKLMRLIRDYEVAGQPDQATRVYEQARRWWPHNRRTYIGRVLGFVGVGNWTGLAEVAPVATAEGVRVNAPLASGLGKAIEASDGTTVKRLCARTDPNSIDAEMCFVALSQAGEIDAALVIADELYPRLKGRSRQEDEKLWLDSPDVWLLYLLSVEPTAPLRRDPRFLPLVDRVGLLDYWRQTKLPDFCTKANEPVCAKIRG